MFPFAGHSCFTVGWDLGDESEDCQSAKIHIQTPNTNIMDQTQSPLSIYLNHLLAGRCHVSVIKDQPKTSQPLPRLHTTRPKRRSIDTFSCAFDTKPSCPSRQSSIRNLHADRSASPPLLPTRRRSIEDTQATVTKTPLSLEMRVAERIEFMIQNEP